MGDPVEDVREILARIVPELAAKQIEIVAIAREVGENTLIVVRSLSEKIDPVSVCSLPPRIKELKRQLGKGGVEIVLWSAERDVFVANLVCSSGYRGPGVHRSLKVAIDPSCRKAIVNIEPEAIRRFSEGNGIKLRQISQLAQMEVELVPFED